MASPLRACLAGADSDSCAAALKSLANPFFLQEQPGGTQTVGWLDAWTSAPSVYAVAAENIADVVAAVNFAREKNLRLVVKGGGHSYLGQSNAPDSLLLWTRGMRGLEMHEAFVPRNGEGKDPPQPAVTVESGAKFLHLYDFVTTRHNRYVQGGGCTTVGVGGHIQTGGFGSFSKGWGMAAAGLLEAEIVTADGQVRVANRHSHPDLFFALRGGGAGYGVLTKLTLRTHPLPANFGFVGQTIRARSDEAFRGLLAEFFRFAADTLVTPNWGEQANISPDNRLSIAMVFQGLDGEAARARWAPFWDWMKAHAADFAEVSDPTVITVPARHWWDYDYIARNLPGTIEVDDRPGAEPGSFWWIGNSGEVGIFLNAYHSAWLPERLLAPSQRGALVDALFAASRHARVSVQFNKGLAGASEEVRREARQLAVNPSVAEAFALAIVSSGQQGVHPGLAGHEPDLDGGRRNAARAQQAVTELRKIVPDSGAYCSEADYFSDNWREASWGPHYEQLLAAKLKYDPAGLFFGHHWVGSEFWSRDGFTPLA